MKVFAISDLHLSFSVAHKTMALFGKKWDRHFEKIAAHWKAAVAADDLVCIAGDISWAMKPEEAKADLKWIGELPGVKCFIKGNHDYWLSSKKKVQAILPPCVHLIQNDAFHYRNIAIGGTRLWDSPNFDFDSLFPTKAKKVQTEQSQKMYYRELQRLEMSLSQMDKNRAFKIALTHYPPLSLELEENEVTKLLERFEIHLCLFGHLHGLAPQQTLFGKCNQIDYQLTACDYLDFQPKVVASL